MDQVDFDKVVRVLSLLGYTARSLGLFVFGLGSGWFSLQAFKRTGDWYVKVAALFGFTALAAMVLRFQSAGAVGSFALGAGAGLLIWGVRQEEDEED